MEYRKDLTYQVGKMAQMFKAFYISKLKKYGLNFEQGLILFLVSEKSGISIGEIVKKLDKDKTTISREVKQLCKKKFLIKEPDANDKRVICLKITDKGRKTLSLLKKSTEIAETIIQNHSSQEELDICLNTLYKIRVALKKALEQYSPPPPVS